MALKESTTNKNQQNYVIGPVMEDSDIPPNPADSLREGALGTRTFPNLTLSRPCERPVALFRRENPNSSPEDHYQVRPEGGDPEEGKFGEDKTKTPPNTTTTLRGQNIRGS